MRTLGNILWPILGGLPMAVAFAGKVMFVLTGALPFAVANVKLAGAALVPFGRTIVPADAARAQSYHVVVGVQPLGG